jgi:membrane protein
MEEEVGRLRYLWALALAWAAFARQGVWQVRLEELPWWRRAAYRGLRVVLLAGRGFRADLCPLRASALTFYTLLSVVPVAAMAFGIAKGFGFQRVLERELYKNFPGQEPVIDQVVAFAHTLLETTQGGLIAGVGLALLFWSVIKVLGNIEASFNDIWHVNRPRSLARKLSDYLTIMLISPVLVILSGSATVFVTTQITVFMERLALPGGVASLITFGLKLMPYTLIWVLFTVVYMVMPNTRVRLTAALTGGVLAGTVYQLVQWGYITFQVGAARASAIYGSFAALPLFLAWLQLSWMIVLLGAEIAYAAQNANQWEQDTDVAGVSAAWRRLAALGLCREALRAFETGGAPLSAAALAERVGLPGRLAQPVLGELEEGGVLIRSLPDGDADPGYLPARDPDQLTVGFVVQALDRRGRDDIPPPTGAAAESIRQAVTALERAMASAPENRRLKDF